MHSLKRLLLSNNKFEGSIPLELESLNFLSELQFDENLTVAVAGGIGCVNRKFGHWIGMGSPDRCCVDGRSSEAESVENVQVNIGRRRLAEQNSNLAATYTGSGGAQPNRIIALPSTRSSGSFPAVPKKKEVPSPSPSPAKPPSQDNASASNSNGQLSNPSSDQNSSGSQSSWKYIVGLSCGMFLLILALVIVLICRTRAAKTIGPWRSGLSGQLQKAFVTGVPKLNRAELETACEDFSNIIESRDCCTLYKGTLSSGVEIAVVATTITSLKDWSKRSELGYRKKIDTLSRINHKNFVNLIGYCEEDEPFIRNMVLEYAPNGTLSEHLHVKELEHLDWNARMRIIMGTAYCLNYMHELNPPVAHSHLNSSSIYLTDDYAAKVGEVSFWKELLAKSKTAGENEVENSELPPLADTEANVYSFGILMLEIISGRLPYSEEQGSLVTWAGEHLNDKSKHNYMIDPTLKSFKENELGIICEVVQDCIQQDPRKRPTMKEVISKLRQAIDISPDAATPRLSPLWWAELEILSQEAA